MPDAPDLQPLYPLLYEDLVRASQAGHLVKIEVEIVDNELKTVFGLGVDPVLLDNMASERLESPRQGCGDLPPTSGEPISATRIQ